MHQHRRRKKRPSYGVRTVEISRGKNGFGFTISGQAPCILSCIINGSPAEKAGLRPGDFLIAVNGQNVSKAPHDDVVCLIGSSAGILKLQIAENYYSDSSEEEFVSIVKLRPKYPNKIRNRQQNSVSRAEKVVQDLQTGALFVDHVHGGNVVIPQKHTSKSQAVSLAGPSRTNKVLLDLILQERFQDANRHTFQTSSLPQDLFSVSVPHKDKLKNAFSKRKDNKMKSPNHPEQLNISSSEVFHSIFTERGYNNILYPTSHTNELKEQAILNAVVGYLGTIEMPKREPQVPNSRLQTIRNCIRRLRIEKKVHTLVLMSVFTESIILINPQGLKLAEFSADKITFSGVYSDDKKFFGLVTNHTHTHGRNKDELNEGRSEEVGSLSSSCHVFMVDPKLTPHHQHLKRAKAFKIACTLDPFTSRCKEFPESAENILEAVVGLYRSKLGLNNDVAHSLEFHANMSPQPGNTSSNSSNSDSGIGFRDEGNASDRVFVVENGYPQYSTNSLDRQAFSNPTFSLLESPLKSLPLSQDSPLSKSINLSQISDLNNRSKSPNCNFDRLTVRAMPDPVGFERNSTNYNSDGNEQDNSFNARNSMHNIIQIREDSFRCLKNEKNLNHITAFGSDNAVFRSKNNKSFSECESGVSKLSPKVFGFDFPLKSVEEVAFCNVALEDSMGWEYASCSTEDSQCPSMLPENQDTTEHEEDGSQDVHPPTEGEDSESDISGVEERDETVKLARTASLRRYLGHKRGRGTRDAGTVSDGELASGKLSTSSSMLALDLMSDASRRSSCGSEHIDVGRVGSWATGFHVLLEDPIGLHAFSEFLKKEFSEENITFYIACEHYRQLKEKTLMAEMAKEIYTKHLCIGAYEPVNVDFEARQIAQDGLNSPTPDLFVPAQKQIFNLMKFDCYQRFLKSTAFKECMRGQTLGFDKHDCHDEENDKFKKKKSLIPWHKLSKVKSGDSLSKHGGSKSWDPHSNIRKSLRKKKDKDSLMHKLDDTSSTQSDMTDRSSLTSSETGMGMIYKNRSSRESLNSAELNLFPRQCGSSGNYCRVILPDLSTTVVRIEQNETVGQMLLKLLEKRNLMYNAVEAYLVGSYQPLDHFTDVRSLTCKEIKVEQVILFSVELPNKKTIGVKAKNNKICGDILKPVLNKYGYKIDEVTMTVVSSQKFITKNASITTIDNERIVVEVKDHFHHEIEKYSMGKNKGLSTNTKSNNGLPDLEQLTNQIFDDLLKTRPEFQYNGLRAIDVKRKKDVKNALPNTNSLLHSSSSPKDLDSLSKSVSVEGIKLMNENKALLPHNPLRLKTYDTGDSYISSVKGITSDTKFDTNPKDFSHGKENCPMSSKRDNSSLSNIDVDYSLVSAFQNMDPGFSPEIMYSASKLSKEYISNSCYSLNDYKESTSETFLQNLSILPADVSNLRTRWSQPPIYPRVHESSSNSKLDSTLIANESFDLDRDVDKTLRAESNESLNFSPDVSAHADIDMPKDLHFSPLRKIPCEPPPVPPKALTRGPPPRPPSRPTTLSFTSEEGGSDEELAIKRDFNYPNLRKEYGEFNISFV